jgi:hypothetical protein
MCTYRLSLILLLNIFENSLTIISAHTGGAGYAHAPSAALSLF